MHKEITTASNGNSASPVTSRSFLQWSDRQIKILVVLCSSGYKNEGHHSHWISRNEKLVKFKCHWTSADEKHCKAHKELLPITTSHLSQVDLWLSALNPTLWHLKGETRKAFSVQSHKMTLISPGVCDRDDNSSWNSEKKTFWEHRTHHFYQGIR